MLKVQCIFSTFCGWLRCTVGGLGFWNINAQLWFWPSVSLSSCMGRGSQSCLSLYPSHIHIPTFLFYLPKSLSHCHPSSFFSLSALLFFHFLHEHIDKDESNGPPNPMKERVKEPKHKHETVTSEFLKLKKSEPARQSFGALGNVLWKWGTAVCFVVDLLISCRLYVAPFSKSIRPYYESNWTEMRCSK